MENTEYTSMEQALQSAPQQEGSTRLGDSWLLGFDTETTGTKPGKDGIVSASLVLRDPAKGYSGDVVATWIVNPHRHISKGASRVNGFTDQQLAAEGMEPELATAQMAGFIARAQDKRIPLLAYNAPFDVHMLDGDIAHWCSGSVKPLDEGDLLVVDPLVLDREISHRSGRRTLELTSEYYGVIPHGNFHDATADTVAAVDLIKPMTTLFPQVARITMGSLMDWQRQAQAKWRDHFNQYLLSQGRRPVTDSWL